MPKQNKNYIQEKEAVKHLFAPGTINLLRNVRCMTELKARIKKCREEVVPDEAFRKRMAKNIRRNRKILEKLAEM